MESLRHLEVFRAVARESSFTRAAGGLHVSQPVVSRTVRELEQSLGVDLFVRTTRSVTLTPEGTELFGIVSDLLDRFDNALEQFASYCRGEYGRIVIATLPSLAAGLLPAVLVDFLAEYPGMRIEILDVTTTEAAQYVQSGKADIAIAAPGPETASLDVRILLRDRFVAVMTDSHALAKRRSVTWKVLAEEPFIAMSLGSSVRQLTDLALAQAEVSPTTVVEARNIATAGGIVAAGLGVSAFPELVLPLMSSTHIATRPLTGPIMHRDIAVITRADAALAPPAQRFVERLRASFP